MQLKHKHKYEYDRAPEDIRDDLEMMIYWAWEYLPDWYGY